MAILLFGEPHRLLTAGCQSQDTVTWSDNLLVCITFPKPVNDGSVPQEWPWCHSFYSLQAKVTISTTPPGCHVK